MLPTSTARTGATPRARAGRVCGWPSTAAAGSSEPCVGDGSSRPAPRDCVSTPPRRRADVAIRGGRIAAIGELGNATATRSVDATGLVCPIVGHVGDGNFHLVVLFDPNDPAERDKAEGLARRVSSRAIAMGGTCTGEHGIGIHKLDALVAEHGEAVDLMRTIKRALDPLDIMNPGKTVPLQESGVR